MMTLDELVEKWTDTETGHKNVNEYFRICVDSEPYLKAHRDFVERNGWGFGERAFHWLWKLLVDEMPQVFDFLEIGIYRGASFSVIELMARKAGKMTRRYGISPLSMEGDYPNFDYGADIAGIHDEFKLDKGYQIYKGLSTNSNIIERAYRTSPYNIIYVDGGHDEQTVLADLANYAPMVTPGGYLVMDDANVDLELPFGMFRGHQSVTNAKQAWLREQNDFEFIFSVVHISVFKKK